jgi:hypothetical protein
VAGFTASPDLDGGFQACGAGLAAAWAGAVVGAGAACACGAAAGAGGAAAGAGAAALAAGAGLGSWSANGRSSGCRGCGRRLQRFRLGRLVFLVGHPDGMAASRNGVVILEQRYAGRGEIRARWAGGLESQ